MKGIKKSTIPSPPERKVAACCCCDSASEFIGIGTDLSMLCILKIMGLLFGDTLVMF
jgi:hypothetical protein